MFVCTGRFGVLHLTKNAETRHTRIHTYTHTFVIFFQDIRFFFHDGFISNVEMNLFKVKHKNLSYNLEYLNY